MLWIPAGDPYHRRPGSGFEIAGIRPDLSPAQDRVAMTRLAVTAERDSVVDDREVRREGPSYTVDTLTEISLERPGSELFLFIGADSAVELHRWRDVDRIREMATIVVAPREGFAAASAEAGPGAVELKMRPVDITSTAVRSLVRRGRRFRHLLIPAVADYIVDHELYSAGPVAL